MIRTLAAVRGSATSPDAPSPGNATSSRATSTAEVAVGYRMPPGPRAAHDAGTGTAVRRKLVNRAQALAIVVKTAVPQVGTPELEAH